MPYASEKQRKFMYSQHPEIAKKFSEEGKNYVKGKKKGPKSEKQKRKDAKAGLKRAFPD